MPAKSEAQRRLLNARFGHAWVKRHHFDNKGPLPERVGGKTMHKAHSRNHHMPRHVKTHKGGLDAHHTHSAMNKKHGTPAGFAPDPDSHHMGHAKTSHLGKNCY